MATAERLLTADEFLAIPGETRYTQLIGGRIVVDDPTGLHQIAVGNIHGALHAWVRSKEGFGRVLLPQTLPMAERHVFSPDLLWYADPDRHDMTRGRQFELPDLIVEVRSPTTWRYDVGVKQTVYEARGIPELWYVDTSAETMLVYRRTTPGAVEYDLALELSPGKTLISPALPGFSMPVDEALGRS